MEAAVIAAWIAASVGLTGILTTIGLQLHVLRRHEIQGRRDAEQRRHDGQIVAVQQAAGHVIQTLQPLLCELQYATALSGTAPTVWWGVRRLINDVSPRQADFLAAVFAARSLGDPTVNEGLDTLTERLPELGSFLAQRRGSHSRQWSEITADLGRAQRDFVADMATHVAALAESRPD